MPIKKSGLWISVHSYQNWNIGQMTGGMFPIKVGRPFRSRMSLEILTNSFQDDLILSNPDSAMGKKIAAEDWGSATGTPPKYYKGVCGDSAQGLVHFCNCASNEPCNTACCTKFGEACPTGPNDIGNVGQIPKIGQSGNMTTPLFRFKR